MRVLCCVCVCVSAPGRQVSAALRRFGCTFRSLVSFFVRLCVRLSHWFGTGLCCCRYPSPCPRTWDDEVLHTLFSFAADRRVSSLKRAAAGGEGRDEKRERPGTTMLEKRKKATRSRERKGEKAGQGWDSPPGGGRGGGGRGRGLEMRAGAMSQPVHGQLHRDWTAPTNPQPR